MKNAVMMAPKHPGMIMESPFIVRYEPMALGEKESAGTIMVMACWKLLMPACFSSLAVMTETGAGVFFSRWWVPVPVTTTGFSSKVSRVMSRVARVSFWAQTADVSTVPSNSME